MARRALVFVLALGAIGGYAAGFAHLAYFHHHGRGWGWGAAREERMAELCTRSAERVLRERHLDPAKPAP